MTNVISMYEAKTNLSKLVKKAQAGEIIYIGAYGQAQAIIAPAPTKKPIAIGVWSHKKKMDAYKYDDLVGPDQDIDADFEKSLDGPL